VGAPAGGILREVVRVAPHGAHVAFEPLPDLARELRAGFPGVDVREAALAETPGQATFRHAVGNPGWSSLVTRDVPGATAIEELTVELVRLDDLALAPRLVKLDVEGSEARVLRGALGTLAEHRPTVVFEHSIDWGVDPGEVHALLTDGAGLRVFDLHGAGPFDLAAFRRLAEDRAEVNWVAHR
jgi:FkbM family methyltransferase